jgi:hypothetical protein
VEREGRAGLHLEPSGTSSSTLLLCWWLAKHRDDFVHFKNSLTVRIETGAWATMYGLSWATTYGFSWATACGLWWATAYGFSWATTYGLSWATTYGLSWATTYGSPKDTTYGFLRSCDRAS